MSATGRTLPPNHQLPSRVAGEAASLAGGRRSVAESRWVDAAAAGRAEPRTRGRLSGAGATRAAEPPGTRGMTAGRVACNPETCPLGDKTAGAWPEGLESICSGRRTEDSSVGREPICSGGRTEGLMPDACPTRGWKTRLPAGAGTTVAERGSERLTTGAALAAGTPRAEPPRPKSPEPAPARANTGAETTKQAAASTRTTPGVFMGSNGLGFQRNESLRGFHSTIRWNCKGWRAMAGTGEADFSVK